MNSSSETQGMVPLHSKAGPAVHEHPGPWRHLQEQVMRIDSTTRGPASDRRRVILVKEAQE